jgi:8-oxo-dGTP diphosphatase
MTKTQHDSETLQSGQQVITVVAVIHKTINNKHKIFLPKRAATKKFLPNVFELPGGHVDYGEELTTALKREVLEELNLEIEIAESFAAFTYLNNIKQTHSVEIVYFAEFTDPNPVIRLNPEDHSEYVWISSDEIEKIYTKDKGADDDEMIVIRKAFEILESNMPPTDSV